MSQPDPFHYGDLLAYVGEGEKGARGERRLSRRRLLRLLAAGGTVAAGGALFGAGFLTRSLTATPPRAESQDLSHIVSGLLPADGFSIDAPWGDAMPRLVELGVVDLDKFSAAASRSGHPLTDGQRRILTAPSSEPIHIDASNGRFVLNALWALGVANRNPILTDGPMATLEGTQRERLASTAGWTLGREPGSQYLARFDIVFLSREQQTIVEGVAHGAYRPCCDNPTAFPDCNHGAAALALAEVAAAAGASAGDIFAALKGFNSFWYPDRYYVLATYFDRQGQAWEDVEPSLVLDGEHSSLSGWKRVAAAVQSGGLPGQLPGQSSGCGA